MHVVNSSAARADFFNLIKNVSVNHEPIFIKGKEHSAVIISDQDWRSIQETLYLASIPGMMESIREGGNEPIEECTDRISFWPGK